MTTALMALFAACTNDDFISNGQDVQNGEAALRPSVDVTLNVLGGKSADTRLGFDGKYQWGENDEIGALLMDEIRGHYADNKPVRPFDDLEEWAEKPWTERYKLVDYASADYQFVRQADGTWKTTSKILEGNYFFTFPFADYQGNREAVHSIGEQVQNGTDVAKAYAENQFFIGYARVHAGTTGEEVMSSDLELTPTLGAIGLTIVNNDDEPFTVKKVVLESNEFSTLIKIDPTHAKYVGRDVDNINVQKPYYNIDNEKVLWWSNSNPDPKHTEKIYFNYANYEEVKATANKDEYEETVWEAISPFKEEYGKGDWVNNTGRSYNYKRQDAVRAIINNVENSGNRAEVTIVDAPALGATESMQVIVMTTPYRYKRTISDDKVTENPIEAYIYTDRGVAGPIVISNVKGTEVSGNATVISENPITYVVPGRKNSVTLKLAANSIQMGAATMDVFNDSDLEQLIDYNEGLKRVYKAELKGDVVLDKEMSDKLMSEGWKESNLVINTNGYKVTLAEGVSKNILDRVIVKGNVEVEGELELGSKSFVNGKYTTAYGTAYAEGSLPSTQEQTIDKQIINIAEGATVTVVSPIEDNNTTNWRQDKLVIGDNEGTLDIDAIVKKFEIKNNEGKMTVGAEAEVTLAETSYNNAGGYVTIEAGGDLSGEGKAVFVNEGTKHGKLLNELRYNEENVEPAIIDNYGRIALVQNDKFGKVIARKDAGKMQLISNAGIVDITENIGADLEIKDQKGDVVYAALKTNGTNGETTAAEILKAGITALQIDGGSVTAPAADGDVVLPLTKLQSTANGGALGSKAKIALPKAKYVEFNGELTLENIDFAGESDPVYVKSGITTIEGKVNFLNSNKQARRIFVASYDDVKYAVVPAELHIAEGAQLDASSITRNENMSDAENNAPLVDKKYAIVDNDGKVYLVYAAASQSKVTWRGDNAINDGDAPVAGATIELAANNQTFAELMDSYRDLSAVKTIKVLGGVDFSKDENSSKLVLSFLKDKEIMMTGPNTKLDNMAASLGVAFKKLTINANGVTVSSGDDNPKNMLMLTLDKLEIKTGGTLKIENCGILMTETAQEGFGSSNVINVTTATVPDPGYVGMTQIKAYDANKTLLSWARSTETWVK